MQRRTKKEKPRHQKLTGSMNNTNPGWQNQRRAKENLSNHPPTHEIDKNREDRGFKRVGVSRPQSEPPDTEKPRTPVDTSRNATVRPSKNLEKMIPGGEEKPKQS
ncbi:hypothetical protein ISN44_As06g043010 [Arabidopsis suecica]|uniref:Uncharacterized protein n=1 Tax=Arabidopsis suecica TaxID=45249 RepID=A0A8T2CTJ0_ARASU|nr:hypothetical protein ISN44_As06g043010 [Arabidopsis suecica]